MNERQIDHGDVVENRYTILVAADDPNMVILRPDLVPDAVERENVYFLRHFKDGQLCDGHLHESLEDARACTDRTKLDALWQDLARIGADIQRQVNAEYAEYRRNGGTLSGDVWLEQRYRERNQPPKRSRAKSFGASASEIPSQSSARPTLRGVPHRKKDELASRASDRGPLPSQTKGDTVQAIVRVGLSIVPPGAAVAELINLVIQPALNRRRDAWLNDLAADVEKLKERPDAPTLEQLSQNDVFVTVMLNASAAAMRTHQTEKLEALRAAVINAALPMPPGEQEQLMFVQLIDDLTPMHLQILRFMRDPAGWFEQHKIPKPEVTVGMWPLILVSAFPSFAGDAEVFSQVMSELVPLGLAGYRMVAVEMSQQQLLEKLTTPLGDRFLDFITASAESR